MKLSIKWNGPIPKKTGDKEQRVYNERNDWVLVMYPWESPERRYHLYCMNPKIDLSADGATPAEAKKNWIAKLRQRIASYQQMLADIESGKEL